MSYNNPFHPSCNDATDDDWGAFARQQNWPVIVGSKERIAHLFKLAARAKVIPYGSYVQLNDTELAISDRALLDHLLEKEKVIKL